MINDFLTSIAKDHCQSIRYVMVCDLENNHAGEAHRFRDGSFRILISPHNLKCPYLAFFVLFHEIKHVLINKFDGPDEAEELAADRWAFEMLGIMDGQELNNEWYICSLCMRRRVRGCYKPL
jgi:hypothetical protein